MARTTILGVHGVNNYQPGLGPEDAATRLAGWWNAAVCKGLTLPGNEIESLSVQVAYYAHRLRLRTAQGDDALETLPPEVQQLIVDWAKLCGLPGRAAQGRISAPVRAAVEWVANTHGLDHRSTRLLAIMFFQEVNTYFQDRERRDAATFEIASAIERYSPSVIIAHSLGSVVAYESLWKHRNHLPIDLLLTLGSPLAMPDIVYHRLESHEGPRGRPPGVMQWINIADPGDFIAVPSGGITLNFQHVTADLKDAIGTFSFHQVTKYLQCGATAGVLSAHLMPGPRTA
jgi:hypothetical protein